MVNISRHGYCFGLTGYKFHFNRGFGVFESFINNHDVLKLAEDTVKYRLKVVIFNSTDVGCKNSRCIVKTRISSTKGVLLPW